MTSAYIDKFCDAIDSIRKTPTSAVGLRVLHGLGEETARAYINKMRDRGWIEPAGHEARPQGIRPVLWRWRQ